MKTSCKTGEPCWRQVRFKLIIGEFETGRQYKAKPHFAYTAKDIERMIEGYVDELEKEFPQVEFRMVRVGPNRYNFIADELRVQASEFLRKHSTNA
jgi:hypothetical protein